MKSPISIVDVDRPDSWTRYKAGLCDTCAANCCTMPVEVKLSDLVRLQLVDPFEAEHEERMLVEETVDVTLPTDRIPTGARHPLTTGAELIDARFKLQAATVEIEFLVGRYALSDTALATRP